MKPVLAYQALTDTVNGAYHGMIQFDGCIIKPLII